MSEENQELLTAKIMQTTETNENATGNDVDATKTEITKAAKKLLPKTQAKKKSPDGIQIRGLPKSGRPWKTPKQKFATIKKTTHRLSFEKKMELRNQMRHIKEVSREIKEKRKEAAVLKNQRRIENAERRLANERRAEVVQIIKNSSKFKRMKKKQMRMIEKRDVSQVNVV